MTSAKCAVGTDVQCSRPTGVGDQSCSDLSILGDRWPVTNAPPRNGSVQVAGKGQASSEMELTSTRVVANTAETFREWSRSLINQSEEKEVERTSHANNSEYNAESRQGSQVTLISVDTDTGIPYLMVTAPTGELVRTPIDSKWMQAILLFKWTLTKNQRREYTYLMSNIRMRDGKVQPLALHRFIYLLARGGFPPPTLVVDHKDREPLNNREDNLRVLPPILNYYNSDYVHDGAGRFPGVSYNERSGLWEAAPKFDRKPLMKGEFETESEAAEAALAALMEKIPEVAWTEELTEEFFPGIQRRSTGE